MRKKISILFIILGVILILSPKLSEYYIQYNNEKIINNLTTKENLSSKPILNTDIGYQPKNQDTLIEDIHDVSVYSVLKNLNKYNEDDIIGILIIPDINVELPIFNEITNANLMAGTVTMKDNLIMGEGNYSIAGHYMKNKNLLFGSLMDLSIDSKVFLMDSTNLYEYRIFETTIVPDTALYMLDESRSIEHGSPIVSLMTCYFSSKTQQRYFAIGELIDITPLDELNENF